MGLYVNVQEAKSNGNDKNPEVTVVIITYNRAEMLRGALESVVCQETNGKFSYEIVVVDNASTDGTKEVVDQVSTNCPVYVRYILEEEKGVPQARNRGVRESLGEWIAFTDDDQLAERCWLKELFTVASKTGDYCVGGNRLLSLSVEPVISLGKVTRSILGEEIYSKEFKVYHRRYLPGTGNILIKRSIFDSIGEFDNSMFCGGSDNDFIRRVFAAGVGVWYAPKAVAHHLIPPYRLSVEYFRLVSYRLGYNFAYIDNKQLGRVKLIMACIARIGQALLINSPRLLWAYLWGDGAEVLGRKCLLWRVVAYTRETLFLLAPRVFTQKHFFCRLEFRRERTSSGGFIK